MAGMGGVGGESVVLDFDTPRLSIIIKFTFGHSGKYHIV